jgi:hypothetical protein
MLEQFDRGELPQPALDRENPAQPALDRENPAQPAIYCGDTPHAEFVPRSVSSRWRTVEVVGLSLSMPVIGWCLKAQDPFFLHGTFPWLVLVPLLIAVQHGLSAAITSAALLCSGVWLRQALGVEEPPGVWAWTAGCFLIALLAGWFKDQSLRRERDLSANSQELGQRWQRLARAHRVLELSHSQLEERLIAQGWSLESVVRRAGAELATAATPARVYALVLDLLACQAQLLAASFFAPSPLRSADSREAVRLDTAPAAGLGKVVRTAPAGASLSAHPIVRRALLTGQVALLAPEPVAEGLEESVLAALPLVASSGRVLGVVVVQEMPFLAFTPATFSELDTILRGIADLVDARLCELRSSAPSRVKHRSGVRLRLDEGAAPISDEEISREVISHEVSLDARLSAAVGEELPPDSSSSRVGGWRG